MKNPCRECDTRHYKCHSICDEYRKYADERERHRQAHARDADISGYCADSYHKIKKSKFRQLKVGISKEE